MSHVNDINDHLLHCADMMRALTDILDQENGMMLFEGREHLILRDTARQELKHKLYAKFESLARIIINTARTGGISDRSVAHEVAEPVNAFRRALRINTLLLETYLERQEARLEGILSLIAEQPESLACH